MDKSKTVLSVDISSNAASVEMSIIPTSFEIPITDPFCSISITLI